MPAGLSLSFAAIEKRFGMRLALRGITLAIAPGEFVALVGANGSGKTTLLRIAALLMRPSAGKVSIGGDGTETVAGIRARCGLISHATLLYDELTAEENLHFFAQLYDLPNAAATCAAALERVGLSTRARDLVRTFSRGMRQRLSLARAMLAAPRLLLLDEPATGLDPAGQSWLGAEVARLHADGCTILMSTHGQNEAQSAVTRAIRLDSGVVAEDSVASGDVRAIFARGGLER
ncbi:MAG: heme ABC exporter ATP-binding protein CcmA [Candidatus Acidiferrales bacterium]|jgi:heme ABC exporter ATP-binding subunit CcmA